ncbi:hypothetical protein, partial [Salmonella sp. SAL4355]|uniref:hypothetical protein n=1 Tax=Salmonella sp. SAL4355 TaxID=3159876 RepID=UPI00397C70BB
MRTLLERSINCLDDRLLLLAPTIQIPSSFENITFDSHRHAELKREMQRLRARVYLRDGAIT